MKTENNLKDFKNYVTKKFLKDFKELKENFNIENCFFTDFKKIDTGLNYTFKLLLDNINNENDIKEYLVLDKNSKVKNKIRGFSIKPYVLCPNMINGSCKVCKICYASKNELAFNYDKQGVKRYYSLEKTLKNFIFYHYCLFIKDYENFLKESLTINKESKNCKILRLNIKSDYIDQQHLIFTNTLFKLLKENYNCKKAYGYTKTDCLDKKPLDKNYRVNDSIILESIKDIHLIENDNIQFITACNLQIENYLLSIGITKCKYQTDSLDCYNCQQCINLTKKFNSPH